MNIILHKKIILIIFVISGIKPYTMIPIQIENRQKIIFQIAFLLSVVCVTYFLWVVVIDDQFNDSVYASALFSLIFLIASLPTYIIYRKRSAYLEKIRSGAEAYKYWTCTNEEWHHFLTARKKLKKGANTGLYILMVIIGLVIGIILSIYFGDILYLYIILGLLIFLAIPAFLFPVLDSAMMPSRGYIVLAERGIYLGGRLYTWNMATARLKSVSLVREENVNILCFVYAYLTLTIQNIDTVYVPLTNEMEKEADAIIKYYQHQRR